MLRDLPPLAMLPAFECAARLGSFKAAALALHVTPSAVSQQIKALEEALGFALFERLGRAVRLTRDGQEYLRDVQHALIDLSSATRRLRRREPSNVLRVSTMDFVAYEFLIPQLAAFRERFPQLELRVETSTGLVDLQHGDFDAALRLGGGPYVGLTSIPLAPLDCAIVCSPQRARTIHHETDVLDHPLIELRGQEARGWHAFARRLGHAGKHAQILTLETYYETVCAAEQGVGLAFGLFPLTSDWVRKGRLAVPAEKRVPLPGGIQFLFREGDPRPELQAIATWLHEQLAKLPRLPAGRLVQRPGTPHCPKKWGPTARS
jgi:LysR family glycine cleavage system transcriptional activator